MKNLLLLFPIIAIMFSCNPKQEKAKEIQAETTIESEEKTIETNYGNQTFAIVWNWKSDNNEAVQEKISTITEELMKLWKANTVENIYYNNDHSGTDLMTKSISFFLKAKDMNHAKEILNTLTIVKKGFAEYTIYPVGTKWLTRNTEVINERGITNSYVAVWNTVTEFDNSHAKEAVKENAQAQTDAILELWNKGAIENAYFDIEGTVINNLKTDLVFFINTKTIEEAKEICENLPFTKKHIASYHLLPVGTFWMGVNEKK